MKIVESDPMDCLFATISVVAVLDSTMAVTAPINCPAWNRRMVL